MAFYLPIRALNRSSNVRINGQLVSATVTSYVDISLASVRKELANHASIAQVYVVGPASASNATSKVAYGLVVSEGASATDLLLAVTAGEVRNDDGTFVAGAVATTVTIGTAPSAGNKRIDLVSFKLSDQTYVVTAGTVVANAATAAVPATPAGQVPLATAAVASSVTLVANASITDVRPRV